MAVPDNQRTLEELSRELLVPTDPRPAGWLTRGSDRVARVPRGLHRSEQGIVTRRYGTIVPIVGRVDV